MSKHSADRFAVGLKEKKNHQTDIFKITHPEDRFS